MKKLTILMLFLSLGLFTVGCNKPKEPAKTPAADTPKDGDSAAPDKSPAGPADEAQPQPEAGK